MQTLAILLMLVLAAPPQRIETQVPDRTRVTRVETAMNHLTVIELAEPVTLAAAGSPLFKVERRENKVFIQPLEEGASTNLFVWTGSARWSYELVPATSPATMHFAIDEQVVPPAQSLNIVTPASAPSDSTVSPSVAEEMRLFAKPIRRISARSGPAQIGVFITDVFRKDDKLFIRYAIDNRTARPYEFGSPEVFTLETTGARTSLAVLRYTEVGPDIVRKIHNWSETRVEVIDCQLPPEPIPPAGAATGILTLSLPWTSAEPTVLKLVFSANGGEPISVTLVL